MRALAFVLPLSSRQLSSYDLYIYTCHEPHGAENTCLLQIRHEYRQGYEHIGRVDLERIRCVDCGEVGKLEGMRREIYVGYWRVRVV